MMQGNLRPTEPPRELVEDLARSLPRWVSWIPIVGKASYRKWHSWKDSKSPSRNITIELLSSRLDVSQIDEASIELHFNVTNFGEKAVELDRLELYRIGVGSRNLQRNSDMIRMTGTVEPHTVVRIHVSIDLYNSDIRTAVQSLSKALNLWSTPSTYVALYADVLCLCGTNRFRKLLQTQTSQVMVNVNSEVVEALTSAGTKRLADEKL